LSVKVRQVFKGEIVNALFWIDAGELKEGTVWGEGARGMKEKVTSWNGENVGSGSVVNEVKFAYNDFRQITDDYQAHGGVVDTSTSPKVQYGYASGSANSVRPTTVTYPNGRVITYGYGTTNSMADALSRITSIVDDDVSSTHLADYSYLGLNDFMLVDYTEPEVRYTLVGTAGGNDPDTGDIYRGLDRFSRVKDCYWFNYGSFTEMDRIKYGFGRNGNRTYRENVVATANGAKFDEKYLYDMIDRLKNMDRGQLTAFHDAITNKTFGQCWSLDATGNWRKFLEDSNGDGAWDLDQTRTDNKVNEITEMSQSVGPIWATPAYNQTGNMTTVPKPTDPTQSFTATYDAWNRLIKLEDNSGIVAQYEYDGAKRRTVKKSYTGGSLTETRHLFYTDPSKWQVVEERVGSSTDPNRQFIWGRRYIDDLILRDRDTDDDGDLDERLYGIQDANWNITATTSVLGEVNERFAYTPFGSAICLSPTFIVRGASLYDWETLFAGYRNDIDTMLYYVRNRYLNPHVGWLQRDPRACASYPNLFSYAANSPLSHVDPDGQAFVSCTVVIAIPPICALPSDAACIYSCLCPDGRRFDVPYDIPNSSQMDPATILPLCEAGATNPLVLAEGEILCRGFDSDPTDPEPDPVPVPFPVQLPDPKKVRIPRPYEWYPLPTLQRCSLEKVMVAIVQWVILMGVLILILIFVAAPVLA
jgi:RHS repeat-associated protein